MNLLSFIYQQSWRKLLLATICGIVTGLSGAALVALISEGVTGKGDMVALGGMFFGLCMLQLATKSFAEITLLRTAQSAVSRLRVDLSRRLLATPLKKLQELGKPALLVILTNDIEMVVGAFLLLPAALGNGIIIATCLGYMAWLSWQIFAILAACLLLCVPLYMLAERVPLKQLAKVREHMDTLYQHFRNLIEGSRELKLNQGRGEFFVNKVIAPATDEFRESFVRGLTGYTWINNVGTALFYLVIGVVLFVVPHWLEQGAAVMTTAILISLYLVRPITELTTMMPAVHQAGIALRKIHQLEGSLAEGGEDHVQARPFSKEGFSHLALRGVSHQYPSATEDSQFMLGPIDLTIHRGEILFIVGGNGSGKTTLAMVLLGLYAPEEGHVLLNGEVVTPATADAYRALFSAVFADFHLFEQLLSTNQADLSARASHYVNEFGMSHKVKVSDGKFSTINLSSGQRKRLALISSYLEDRAIYLFDEWAADQDPVFKRIFYTALLPDLKARGKTVIVITHDDGYFDYADRIVKLQDGQLQPMTEHRPEVLDIQPISMVG